MKFTYNASQGPIMIALMGYVSQSELPAEWRTGIIVGLGLVIYVVGMIAQFWNPNGTPAEASWKRKPKRND